MFKVLPYLVSNVVEVCLDVSIPEQVQWTDALEFECTSSAYMRGISNLVSMGSILALLVCNLKCCGNV